MSSASTQRTCGRKPVRAFVMTVAERKASTAAYQKRLQSGAFSIPAHARKSMNLTPPKETAS